MSYKNDLQVINAELERILTTINTFSFGEPQSGLPIEVSNETVMTAILNSATAKSVGSIYKYVGATTSTYEHGALYIIMEESE